MSDFSLEIHHLDVRGGDATAIIVKDLEQEILTGGKTVYRMLIDAGAEGSGSAALKSYLETYLPGEFHCIIATHFHQDHIQGFREAEIKFKNFVDNGAYKDGEGNLFKPKNDIGRGARTTLFSAYQDHIQKKDSGGTWRKRIPIPFIESTFNLDDAKPFEIELGTGTGIKLICYAANGILANGTNVLEDQRSTGSRAISPNDVSLALVLQWGDFRYFTAGDLSGDEFQSSYYDIEKHLVKYLTGPRGPLENRRITVMKASHHGSEHSNHPNTLKSLKPDTIIVCCNIQKQVPSPIFLERLKTYLEDMKAIAVFTNSMKVFKADDRYPQLLALNDLIATGNVKFTGDVGEEQFASNLGIKCAVIRRRVQNGVPVNFTGYPVKPHKKIKRSGYEILLMDRDPLDEKNIAATVKFRAYDMRRGWDIADASLRTIKRGFVIQAKQIAHWLTEDTRNRGTLGGDYIDKYYPGLRRTLNELTEDESKDEKVVADKLYDKIFDMFDVSFDMTDTLFLPKGSNLTSDEKMTLRALMVDNYFQPEFNAAAMYFNRKRGYREWFDPDYAWNVTEAPAPFYDKGNKRPAGRHAPEDLKKAKKRKK